MRFPNTNKQVIDKSFRVFWVLLTYFMAVLIPKLEIMIPLVGVTSGTLCALVYPPLFQIITFWEEWKLEMTPRHRWFRIGINVTVMCIGFFAIGAGLYANVLQISKTFFSS
uniref:Amino acid transporter transmembrane domain-containing protein n=1 Tax=Panagrolaimus sp. ES5 TaxID=591445 RepID=A0AC34GC85_9BILA